MTNPTVFISYSHKDEEWKDRLVTQLGVLEHEDILDLWDDRRIETGEDWFPEIENAINTASIAVLMVSANFLTSKFILKKEIPRLLERRKKEGVKIFPVILKPCAWKTVEWLARMQVRPKDGKPISGGNDYQIDVDFAAIAKEIAELVKLAEPTKNEKHAINSKEPAETKTDQIIPEKSNSIWARFRRNLRKLGFLITFLIVLYIISFMLNLPSQLISYIMIPVVPTPTKIPVTELLISNFEYPKSPTHLWEPINIKWDVIVSAPTQSKINLAIGWFYEGHIINESTKIIWSGFTGGKISGLISSCTPVSVGNYSCWINMTFNSSEPSPMSNFPIHVNDLEGSSTFKKICTIKVIPEEFQIDLPDLPQDATPLTLVRIKAGTFKMGSPGGELDRNVIETLHAETITKDFYIGKYEVTQAQWEAVMGTNPSYFQGNPNHPVEKVSWNDCQIFIKKLNQLSKETFRLPTEAEWEYACRAGTHTRFYWGDDLEYKLIDEYAWFDGNNKPYVTKEVGQKEPNAWGLYDISGNVWEWCEDDWHENYNGAPADGSAWKDSPRISFRVLRGGGWLSIARYCRSAPRNRYFPENRISIVGLRLARTK